MELTVVDIFLWAIGTALTLALCVLIFCRGLHRQLPFFASYAVILLVEDPIVWLVYRTWGFRSRPAFYVAWLGQSLVLIARAIVLAELCWTALKKYPLIWHISRLFLVLAACVVLTYATFAAMRNVHSMPAFILTAEHGVEFSILVSVLALFICTTYYRVGLERKVEQNIAIGLAIYSAFQAINNIFMRENVGKNFEWWNYGRIASFDLSLVVWIVPLLSPIPPPQQGPPFLLLPDVAHEVLEMLLCRMRQILSKLEELRRLLRK